MRGKKRKKIIFFGLFCVLPIFLKVVQNLQSQPQIIIIIIMKITTTTINCKIMGTANFPREIILISKMLLKARTGTAGHLLMDLFIRKRQEVSTAAQ